MMKRSPWAAERIAWTAAAGLVLTASLLASPSVAWASGSEALKGVSLVVTLVRLLRRLEGNGPRQLCLVQVFDI